MRCNMLWSFISPEENHRNPIEMPEKLYFHSSCLKSYKIQQELQNNCSAITAQLCQLKSGKWKWPILAPILSKLNWLTLYSYTGCPLPRRKPCLLFLAGAADIITGFVITCIIIVIISCLSWKLWYLIELYCHKLEGKLCCDNVKVEANFRKMWNRVQLKLSSSPLLKIKLASWTIVTQNMGPQTYLNTSKFPIEIQINEQLWRNSSKYAHTSHTSDLSLLPQNFKSEAFQYVDTNSVFQLEINKFEYSGGKCKEFMP